MVSAHYKMADIDLYHEESDDSQHEDDEGGLGIDDGEDYGESYNPDEGLSPLQKLEKYMESENFYNRQMVARSLLEVMRMVADTDENANVVLKSMMKLSDDPECGVRTELMEQIPHIAMYCAENRDQFEDPDGEEINDPIGTYILPIIVKYLLDTNNQVRKTSQAAMLVLLEQELITKFDVEHHICPVIMEMSSPDSEDDFRTEAVALMSKMAPLVGKDLSEKLFLPRFAEMCTDALFHVRKVCAANFGDMCAVVGQDNTEKTLLYKFYYLCEDGVWGVRKACAECFMQVSCSTSQEVRREQLSQLFISLVCDQSRWVRMAAFQALGGFISTFADPTLTGLFFNEDGVLMVGNPENENKNARSSDDVSDCDNTTEKKLSGLAEDEKDFLHLEDMEIDVDEIEMKNPIILVTNSENKASGDAENKNNNTSKLENKNESEQPPSEGSKDTKDESNESFNEFLYWRPPLPDLDIEIEPEHSESSAEETKGSDENNVCNKDDQQIENDSNDSNESAKIDANVSNIALELKDTHLDNSKVEENSSENEANKSISKENVVKLHTADVVTVAETPAEEVANIGSMHVVGQQVDQHTMAIIDGIVKGSQDSRLLRDLSNNSNVGKDNDINSDIMDEIILEQDVIPQALLEHYLSMTDPSRAQTVDSEIALHCAYSLPAVAYTLGKRYWPCLRELYETLAADMQWKVRRTLAFSIHELALIVGTEITCRDLVPIFNGFLKDLDEVRIGVLRHLADFLKLLTTEIRADYLSKINEFLNTDNNRNWRFREELAKQLVLLLELYPPLEISQHLVPIALTLAEDSVAQVRHAAFKVLSVMLKHLSNHPDQQIQMAFINDLLERFAQSKKACQRQMFAHVCNYILMNNACPSVERFARDLLPSLLALGSDKVPNVRITLSKVLAQHVLYSDYFTSPNNPHHEDLLNTVQQLKSDPDRDVRYFVSLPSSSETADSIPV